MWFHTLLDPDSTVRDMRRTLFAPRKKSGSFWEQRQGTDQNSRARVTYLCLPVFQFRFAHYSWILTTRLTLFDVVRGSSWRAYSVQLHPLNQLVNLAVSKQDISKYTQCSFDLYITILRIRFAGVESYSIHYCPRPYRPAASNPVYSVSSLTN